MEMDTVSKPALLARINRRLAQEDGKLKKVRGERARLDLGDYYVVDVNRNRIVATRVDPETFAREIGALKPYERVEKP